MTFASDLSSGVERILGLPAGSLAGIRDHRAVADVNERLGGRNLGLLPVADPASFSWAGHWIGIAERPGGARSAVVMFGVPSGPLELEDATLLDGARLVGGYVIAPFNLDLPHDAGAYGRTTTGGIVEAIFTAPTKEAPCLAHELRAAYAGRGLEGDRYARGDGTFSHPERGGQDLTVIAAESIEAMSAEGYELTPAEARRNIVTRGIDIEGLIGQRVLIGDVECRAVRLAEPCAHLQRVTRPGVLRGLVHRGGIRLDVLADGTIALGDEIRPLS